MDLRQLRYFVATVEHGGLRRAARELYVSQPSITNAIQSLEAELGVELLIRSPHGVLVTEHGRELLRYASEILAQADRATAAMRRISAQRSATLRIALSSGLMAAGELTLPILEAFRSEHPDVRLEVKITELSFGDTGPVLGGEVDAAFMRGPLEAFEAPRLELIPIAEEPRVLLVGAAHELAEADSVDVDEVMDEPTLGLIGPSRWRSFWQLDDVRRRASVDERVPPVRRPSEIQFAIADSSAVLSMPSAMARMTPSPHVAAVPLRGAEMSTIGLVRRKDERNPAVSAFLDLARTTAANNIAMLPGGRLPG